MLQFTIKPEDRFPDFIPPKRATKKAAGFDLFAQEDMIITEDTTLFDLGFRARCPKDHVGIIFPRSGLGAKFQMQLSNTNGIIDEDYNGIWMAALHLGGKGTQRDNLSNYLEAYQTVHGVMPPIDEEEDEKYAIEDMIEDMEETEALLIKRGEAFAQVLFFPVPEVEVVITHEELPDTERGEGGFGSTTKSSA